MPSTTLSRTSSAIFLSSLALLTWYGISVTTIALRSLLATSSIAVRARSVMDPRPVWYASAMPARPTMNPPVGKSGPGISRRSSRAFSTRDAAAFSASHTVPSITSRRLCGGMLVAMPTAIPAEPLTSRLGNGAGRTAGSLAVSS